MQTSIIRLMCLSVVAVFVGACGSTREGAARPETAAVPVPMAMPATGTPAKHLLSGLHIVSEAPETCPVCNLYRFRRDSVVRIRTETGLGTGVVVDAAGMILTNAHVVGDSPVVAVETYHGTIVKGTVLRRSKDVDLALIKTESPDVSWASLSPDETSEPVVGSKVFVIGHPAGLGWTLTEGIVSGRRKGGEVQATSLIQITAAVSPGNSGGPAMDAEGRWIGTVSSKLVGPGLENISFVIPAAELRVFMAGK